ncbi:hypothetical protein D3C81_680210 [compost metagenome]
MGLGQRRLGRADLQLGAQADAPALHGQRQQLLALLELGLGDVQLGVLARQLDIGAHHAALQLQRRGARLGGRHPRLAQRLLALAAQAAPQVEVVTQAEGGGVVPAGGARQRTGAVEVVVRPALALHAGIQADLRRLRRRGDPGQRLRPAHARRSHGQAGTAGQCTLDPGVQLRIAIGLPPLRARPVGALGGVANGRVGGQFGAVGQLGLRGYATAVDAAGKGRKYGNQQTGEEQTGPNDGGHCSTSWMGAWGRGRLAILRAPAGDNKHADR